MAKTLPGAILRIRRRGYFAMALFLAGSVLVPLPIYHAALYVDGVWLLVLVSIPIAGSLAQWRVLARAEKADFRLCPECEHTLDVKGGTHICPQCGRPFDTDQLPRDWLGFGRRYRRYMDRYRECRSCGYDRLGLSADAKCPECGTVPAPAA